MKWHSPSSAGLAASVAAAAFLAACQGTYPGAIPADFQITLERGPCFGACPVYSLTVSADGTVQYEGLNFVTVEGNQEASLAADEVEKLFQAVVSADFFALDDSYAVLATDLPSITTTVTVQGRTKSVYHYGLGCGTDLDTAPPQLCALEALLASIPASQGWVSGG